MGFLNLWALWIAAGAVPVLLLLYFLKLRRRQETVASTLLWRRAVQDLQVNAPFQKLRKNLLLLLQLLVLAAAIIALARPIVETTLRRESRLVLLIDRSASMNTRESERTRLDLAKEQAVRLVRTLNQTGSRWFRFAGAAPESRVMVIAFADRATVVAPFTSNVSELGSLIEAIEPGDGRTNLQEALELAEAYMTTTTVEQTPQSPETASKLVLISDGGVADLQKLTLRSARMEHIPIGETQDNVGITAIRLQRNYESPEQLTAFVQVRNFGPQPVSTDVTILVDGVISTVRALSLAPAAPREPAASQPADDEQPTREATGANTASLRFEFKLDRSALLEARLRRSDALPADDAAWAVVPPPRKLRVLLVSAKNFFLESVLSGLPLESVAYLTPEQYEKAPADEIEQDGRSRYDVVLFDKHNTARLPVGNYLFIGAVPKIEGVSAAGERDGQALMWWDEAHPVLRHVTLDYVVVSKWLDLTLPPEAEHLIEGPTAPVLSRYLHAGRQYLILAFPIEYSNWWQHTSFPLFAFNAVRFLGSTVSGEEGTASRPGEALQLQLPAGAERATITTPSGATVDVRPDEAGLCRFANTERVGVYAVDPPADGRRQFAVNLEDEWESDVAPRRGLRVGAQELAVRQGIDAATPEIWRWFVGAALLVALFEWYVYNRRVFV